MTKTYTENKEEEITITDIAGNTVKTTIKITDIEEKSETKKLKIIYKTNMIKKNNIKKDCSKWTQTKTRQ